MNIPTILCMCSLHLNLSPIANLKDITSYGYRIISCPISVYNDENVIKINNFLSKNLLDLQIEIYLIKPIKRLYFFSNYDQSIDQTDLVINWPKCNKPSK